MGDMIKDWLLSMYNDEIVEEEDTIDNEQTWADGAPDAETRIMHENNIRMHKEYLGVLRKRRTAIAEGDY